MLFFHGCGHYSQHFLQFLACVSYVAVDMVNERIIIILASGEDFRQIEVRIV